MVELVFTSGNNIVYLYGALLKTCASLSVRYLGALCVVEFWERFFLFVSLLKPSSDIFQWGEHSVCFPSLGRKGKAIGTHATGTTQPSAPRAVCSSTASCFP